MTKKRNKRLLIGFAIVLIAASAAILFKNLQPKSITVESSSEEDVYTLSYDDANEIADIYDVEIQKQINTKVEELKNQEEYNEENMLYFYNPYRTNNTSLYVYFETEEAASVAYNVHVNNEKISDFTRTFYNDQGDYATTHEYQLIGLIPNEENNITFTITTESGDVITKQLIYTAPALQGTEEIILESTDGESTEKLSNGLYAVLGNDSNEQDFMYFYDNDGVIRGEIPIIDYRSHRILFNEDSMYFSISETQIGQINNLGQVTGVFDLEDDNYTLHHDYVFDSDNNILVLATNKLEDRVEDFIVKVDTQTGEVTEVLDSMDLFPNVYDIATGLTTENLWDPIHYNTIQWIGNDTIIVSARENSSIVKISNIYTEPTVDYIIADEAFWEGTGYEELLLSKSGDFESQIGQHAVTFVEDDSLEEGQYYLYLFHNNVAYMPSRADFDWSRFEDAGTVWAGGNYSSYYRYLVDENKGTYELVNSFELPYSSIVSNVQEIENNVVFDSGITGIFGEYDSDNQLIRSFTMALNDRYIYRVYKYTFDGFYFQ